MIQAASCAIFKGHDRRPDVEGALRKVVVGTAVTRLRVPFDHKRV